MKYIKINQFYDNVPVKRTFCCSFCSNKVNINNEKDKRVKYCSQKCEKQYWRNKSKEMYKKRRK